MLKTSFAAMFALAVSAAAFADALPASFETAGKSERLRVTGVGAQIYVCAKGTDGGLVWTFREPVAALIDSSGKTVGRHFAGPTWEFSDLSAIVGKVVAKASGATPADIPLLKLDVASHSGKGSLDAVQTVLRLETKGGQLAGPCEGEGALRAEPYTATYVFLN